MNAAGILINKAADEMDKRGQAQYTYATQEGSICAIMALNLAAGGTLFNTSKMESFEVSEARGIIQRAVGMDLCEWNNSTNKEGVVAKLREIAKAT